VKITKNERGFSYGKFKDKYNQICSIQKSSAAMYDAIWLGIENTGPDISGPSGLRKEEVMARMHLTQKDVKKLLPILIKFVETGEI